MPAYIFSIALIVSLLLLLVIMLVLIISYHDMVKKFRYAQKENTFLKNHLHERSVEVLDGARARALALLEEAEKKAAEIVTSAKAYETNASSLMEKTLTDTQASQAKKMTETTDTLLKTYAADLQSTESENIKTLQMLSKSIEDKTRQETSAFESMLTKEAAMAKETLTAEMQTAEAAAEKEIAAYKTERIQRVDEKIMALLGIVAKDVFGKTLPLVEHERIVLESLETAKKDLLKN